MVVGTQGAGRFQYIKEYTVGEPVDGVTALENDILKHTKDFIFNAFYIGYMII